MNNEEPIELAHYPAAKPPAPGEKPKIERDDFPAPPCPYTDPGKYNKIYWFVYKLIQLFLFYLEKRKTWFDNYKGISDDEDEVDKKGNIDSAINPKLKVDY